jgi:hypothetical protein
MSVDQSIVTGHMDLGGIIGSINGGNASNLKVDNTSVDANGKTIGGAIGWQSGIVDGVTVNNVEVRGPRQVGGVVGKIDLDADGNTKSTLTNAVSDANITATYNGLFPIDDKNISSFFGGIAGMADQSSVNGDFTGNISDPNGYFDASKSRVGTLVGASYASAVDGEDKNSEVVGKYEKIGYTSDQPVTR